MAIVPLVKKPAGSGYEGEGPDWSKGSRGWIHASDIGCPVTCGLCGTVHEPIDDSDVDWDGDGDIDADEYAYHLFDLLGRTVVYECCGRVIDHLYDLMGEMFAHEFLKDSAGNPTGGEFSFLLSSISYHLRQSRHVLDKATNGVIEAQDQCEKLEQSLRKQK